MAESKKDDQKFELVVRSISPPKLITKTIILVYDVPTDMGIDVAGDGGPELILLFPDLVDMEFLYPDGVVDSHEVKVIDAAGNEYEGAVGDIEAAGGFSDVMVFSPNPWPPDFQITVTFITTYGG